MTRDHNRRLAGRLCAQRAAAAMRDSDPSFRVTNWVEFDLLFGSHSSEIASRKLFVPVGPVALLNQLIRPLEGLCTSVVNDHFGL
jgi:hypothetical protein